MKNSKQPPELTEEQLLAMGFTLALNKRYFYGYVHPPQHAEMMVCLFPVEAYEPNGVFNVSLSNMQVRVEHTNQHVTQVSTLALLRQTLEVLSHF